MKTFAQIILMVMVVAITGCQKHPRAGFTLNAKTFFPGDKIIITNTTIDGYRYEWTIAGKTYTTKDVELTAGSNIGDRSVKLEAFSKNGKKTNEASDAYTVIDFYNKSFAGTYNGNSSNYFYKVQTGIVVNGNDKITVDDGLGRVLDFTVTSATTATLAPKIVYQWPYSYNYFGGTITKSGNILTISITGDFIDNSNSLNNKYNYTTQDFVVKQ